MASLLAVNGRVTFFTRGVTKPTGRNSDGGWEYILARIKGNGFERLLIMAMGGNRPPSRIWFNHKRFVSGAFPVPLLDEAKWEVYNDGTGLVVDLDGKRICRCDGQYRPTGAVMNGYAKRESTGEWKSNELPKGDGQ